MNCLLSASRLGCSNDFSEALITAQRIPARIEAEIAVCRRRVSRDRRDNFELLERAVALARPRVNEGQVRDTSRTGHRVLGYWPELKSFFFELLQTNAIN
jgi:hypothetical protein